MAALHEASRRFMTHDALRAIGVSTLLPVAVFFDEHANNIPNGFLDSGSPTNVVFYARSFGEMELLALAKAYEDTAGFHLRPTSLDP